MTVLCRKSDFATNTLFQGATYGFILFSRLSWQVAWMLMFWLTVMLKHA